MKKSKILNKSAITLKNAKIIHANEPKIVTFCASINNENLNTQVEVEDQVVVGQTLVKKEDTGEKIISTINGKVTNIEEKQNKDGSFSFYINIENNFIKKPTLKKLINGDKIKLKERIKETYIFELERLDTSKNIVIDTRENKTSLGLNRLLFEQFFSQVLKGTKLIQKAYELPEIFLLVEKKDYENTAAQVAKLNLTKVTVVKKKPRSEILLNLQTALDFYEAVSNGEIRTEHFIAVSGEAIKDAGYYLVKIGTPLNELISLCGNLKYTYEEIENFKEDALMAVNDEVQIKKEIKESKETSEKAKLKKLLIEKQEEAKRTIFSFFEENKKKYGLCLANMILLENGIFYEAKSPYNQVNHNTQAVLFLSNNETKTKVKK